MHKEQQDNSKRLLETLSVNQEKKQESLETTLNKEIADLKK